MLFILSFSFVFFGQFLLHVLPDESSLFAVNIMLAAAFLSMTFGLYFSRALSKSTYRPFLFHCCASVPLLGIAVLAARSPLLDFDVIHGPYWRTIHYSGLFSIVIFGLLIYTVSGFLSQSIAAYRRAKSNKVSVQERTRLRLILKGAVIANIWMALSFLFMGTLEAWNPFLPTVAFSSYSVIIFLLFIRYATVNYDFLSTTGRRYQILFDLSPNGIVLLDELNRIVEANPALLRLIGVQNFQESHWKRERISTFVTIEGDGTTYKQLTDALANKEIIQLELQIRNHINEVYIIEINTRYMEVEGRIWTYMTTKDVTMQNENERKLSFLAYHDPLTGLLNRRRFYEMLDLAIGQTVTANRVIAVISIDLDRFKCVNDTLGHSAGDELLQTVAERLLSCSPSDACIARMGGDEFVILLQDISPSTEWLTDYADRLNVQLGQPVLLDNNPYRISASIGIDIVTETDADAKTVLTNADKAMYAAKQNGRNQYCFFDAEIA
ncbi:diguanylate cyclase [Paenibacillus sp. sptzw28]|uniref:diguanylate cyclase domain-containing protein n=1 Tax=Paenibacillus sp. sptzw28 TaxID=715179 RepID=UPI001C6E4D77|nr:diguanylate cyclase [Paenibacillus sp. sptzw28]QYR22434.1 diguanylate cyclase [Paenibacillus sp. sptzw28]